MTKFLGIDSYNIVNTLYVMVFFDKKGIYLKHKHSKNETLKLFISYRTFSIIFLTLVYILIWNIDINYPKIFIVLGMLISSTVGTFLYKNNYPDNNKIIIATIIMESVAYIVFIILSGGFYSPYLWYFINLLIVIMALKPFKKNSKLIGGALMVLMLISVFIPKHIKGVWETDRSKYVSSTNDANEMNNISNITYSDINTSIAFIVVSLGFYLLFESYDSLLEGRTRLYELNIDLEKSKKSSDYALRHTMNVYDALNVFSISNP